MKIHTIASLAFLAVVNVMASEAATAKEPRSNDMNTLILTQEWDKTFPQSSRVKHSKITFHNCYGITLAAGLYQPQDAKGLLVAIAVSGLLVKEK